MKYISKLLVGGLMLTFLTFSASAEDGLALQNLDSYMRSTDNLMAGQAQGYNQETVRNLKKFQKFFDKIHNNWVEQPNDEELINAAIEGMIKTLDKHSSYIKPEDNETFHELNTGSFSGIGAEVAKDEETHFIKVVAPIDDSPAIAAGLKTGDLIKEVDGKKTDISEDGNEISLQTAVKWIRGPSGTTVKLKIIRDGVELPKTVDIIRGNIHHSAVKGIIIDNDIAFVRISEFSGGVSQDFVNQIITLDKNNPEVIIKGLVLDLRGDPGGLLSEAIDLVDLFVTEGNIVHTKNRSGEVDQSADASSNVFIVQDLPVVILINGGSASASEIVSAALSDLHRTTAIVGTKSYGKGSVQTIYDHLYDNYGLRLTTQYYYTASERKIHGVGITPDVVLDLPKEYKKDTWDQIDPQMEAAIQIIRTGYNENCKWSIVMHDSPHATTYSVEEVCPRVENNQQTP